MEDYLFYALIIGVAGVASFKLWRGVEVIVSWIPIPHSIATLTEIG